MMRITYAYLMTLLVGGAAAAALGAPISTAPMTPKDCVVTGVASTWQSPANVKITDYLPAINFHHYGAMPFLLGNH
jgi:hypothetical protein